MTTYMCMKSAGTFRQGRIYTFTTLTAVAAAAIRAGILKALPITVAEAKTLPVQAPVKKKIGRPRKVVEVEAAPEVIDVVADSGM